MDPRGQNRRSATAPSAMNNNPRALRGDGIRSERSDFRRRPSAGRPTGRSSGLFPIADRSYSDIVSGARAGPARFGQHCPNNRVWRMAMKWAKPVIREYCVGMEVTSYESAEIEPDTLI